MMSKNQAVNSAIKGPGMKQFKVENQRPDL